MTTKYSITKILATATLGVITTLGVAFAAPAQATDLDYAIKNGGNTATRAATRLLKKGDAREAAGIYLAVVRKGEREALVKLANTNLCAAQAMLGNYADAIAACDAALALDATYWEALVNRGNAHFLAGDKAAALQDFQAAQKAEPGEALINRAIAAVEAGIAPAGGAR